MLFVTAPLFLWLIWKFPKSRNEKRAKKNGTFDVLFLGTGVSTGLPGIAHALNPRCRTVTKDGVKVCVDALRPGSKNRRCNVSIVIDATMNDGSTKRILVDAGKTFRETMLRHAVPNGISSIDGLIVTHPHADAMLGLDDLRDLQAYKSIYDEVTKKQIGYQINGAFPIISNEQTINHMQKTFPYLVGGNLPWVPGREKEFILERRVLYLDWITVDNNAELLDETFGIPIRFFPVFHGKPLISLGFAFGESFSFVYISDVSEVLPESVEFLKSIPVIRVLVLDALMLDHHFSHFSLSDAIGFAKSLGNVQKTLLVGMGCSCGDHDVRNAELKKEDIDVQLAYDGQWLRDFQLH